ncbi:unnamed protein product [Brassica oleracea]
MNLKLSSIHHFGRAQMKDMVLEGGDAFGRSHGAMKLFDYMGTDERFSKLINQTGITIAVVKKALEVYEGFQGVNVLVDVGGVGNTLGVVTSKYPNILKHLLTPNVEHVAGDMFIDVPTGDAMILKASSTIHFYFLKAAETGGTNANIAFDMDM